MESGDEEAEEGGGQAEVRDPSHGQGTHADEHDMEGSPTAAVNPDQRHKISVVETLIEQKVALRAGAQVQTGDPHTVVGGGAVQGLTSGSCLVNNLNLLGTQQQREETPPIVRSAQQANFGLLPARTSNWSGRPVF